MDRGTEKGRGGGTVTERQWVGEGEQRQWCVWASAGRRRAAAKAKGATMSIRQRKEGIEDGSGRQGKTTQLSEGKRRGAMVKKVVANDETDGDGSEHDGYGEAEDGGGTKNQANFSKPGGLRRDVPQRTTTTVLYKNGTFIIEQTTI